VGAIDRSAWETTESMASRYNLITNPDGAEDVQQAEELRNEIPQEENAHRGEEHNDRKRERSRDRSRDRSSRDRSGSRSRQSSRGSKTTCLCLKSAMHILIF